MPRTIRRLMNYHTIPKASPMQPKGTMGGPKPTPRGSDTTRAKIQASTLANKPNDRHKKAA